MFGVCELARVKAIVFEPGDEQDYDALLKHENDLWWFSNPDITTVWDALLEDIERGETGVFTVRSIRFIIDGIANPNASNVDVSYLHTWLSGGQDLAVDLFGDDEENNLGRMADVVLRLVGTEAFIPGEAEFIGMFDVVFDWYYDNDGHKDDFTCVAIFLGELDLRAKLPMTTNELEMKLLRTIPQACDFGQIINNFQNVDSWLIKSALERLISDRLVTLDMNMVPARYSITEAGFALVGAA